ncbi:unnamed protein product [Vitrella brassicaformis CCMP3155]|uniref:Eukaryotic translation initiation factor 3 subunit L n=2 Tax=Vitrella brassicaformis TaxID=1169539 RepID=A0A0G4FH27_VITBC|nr:unnamed protein product [Vitrella brassicaformis CCMP3155]|mmetsp:Transcript_25511/g.63198  ORF Transcript_25511/g.63198 Transcript_25511/m.63198 type:complete len:590 (+) Transcript_25511:109-1878(+)|eukprot:CEM12161.1 unnamed protein product [Vitrella brassicaformis CCMP3155]
MADIDPPLTNGAPSSRLPPGTKWADVERDAPADVEADDEEETPYTRVRGERQASSHRVGGGGGGRGDPPPQVQSFLRNFYEDVEGRKVGNIENAYEGQFPRLSDQYYSKTRWVDPSSVSRYYADQGFEKEKDVVLILYKELFYRHLHTVGGPESAVRVRVEDREDSWGNYRDLFDYFLEVEMEKKPGRGARGLQFPYTWTFDMLDEFVYQWSQFKFFHNKTSQGRSKRSDDDGRIRFREMVALADRHIWDSARVIEYLQLLVNKSGINQYFRHNRERARGDDRIETDLGLQVGYFAIVQLLRVQCLVGDYRLALQQLDEFDFSGDSLFYRVPNCHLSLFYYMGFSYMMLRRYTDAVRVFSQVLTFLHTKKDDYLQGTAMGHLLKMKDRMYQLLLLCVCLHPHRLDESINMYLKDKHADRHARLLKDDEQEYIDVFNYASPKFVHPGYPPFDDMDDYDPTELSRTQVEVFLEEVRHQKLVPTIRSFAKLYTAIPIQKLASLMEKNEDEIREILLCVKHKGRQLVWRSGPPLSGEVVTMEEGVDFFLDHEMIHVKSTKIHHNYVQYFVHSIHTFKDMIRSVEHGLQRRERV